jgi:methionyl-tRNA synthetase
MDRFYITSAIPYVNAKPHMGHALEFVEADTIARYERAKGKEVFYLCGSDENAIKNVQAAEKAGTPLTEFIDTHAQYFLDLAEKLNVKFDTFIKGSDTEYHFPSSQKLWELCDAAGDIYKKSYEGLYCVGCELFYTADELTENGECFEHPGRKLETVSEENYFFKLSKYQDQILELITSNTLEIVPETRKNEMLSFLKQPLQDISISRSNERAKNWGVPVPNDPNQRMYVWFDALNIYQSGVGFGFDDEKYKKWWPADLHVIGKGITRFHAIYWPAFLLSAKLQIPKKLFVHGYITVDGQKMSKTIGNVIDPIELADKYGGDALRYYLLREIPPFDDGDFSIQKFEDRYNGDLANGLGNLVARVSTLGEKISPLEFDLEQYIGLEVVRTVSDTHENWGKAMGAFRLNEALGYLFTQTISFTDKYINEKKPWELEGEELKTVILNASYLIHTVATLLAPFLPETSKKILESISFKEKTLTIKKGANLFPRF